MARTFSDVILETSQTLGTGQYELSGAVAGYLPFSSAYITGDQPYYAVRNARDTKFELNRGGGGYIAPVGTGIGTLARNVFLSSNANAPVLWQLDDLPLVIYVPRSAETDEGQITGWLSAVRNVMIRFGLWWKQNTPTAGKHQLTLFDGTDDIPFANVDTTTNKITLDATSVIAPGYLPLTGGTLAGPGTLVGTTATFVGSAGAVKAQGTGTGQTSIELIQPGNAADQKTWELITSSTGAFGIRSINDAYSLSQYAINFTRGSGYTVAAATIGASLTVTGTIGTDSVGSTIGRVLLNPGDATHMGYVAYYSATGVRQGYIGYSQPIIAYAAEITAGYHNFTCLDGPSRFTLQNNRISIKSPDALTDLVLLENNASASVYTTTNIPLTFGVNNAQQYTLNATALFPAADNTNTLGGSANRWSTIFGVLGDFTSTITVGPSGSGTVRLQPGGATTTGFVAIHKADASRLGYIGNNNSVIMYNAELAGSYHGFYNAAQPWATITNSGYTLYNSTIGATAAAIIQHDGTHMYVRPQNAASNLYLGAAGANYAVVTSTGHTIPNATKVSALGSSTNVWSALNVVDVWQYGATSGTIRVVPPAVAGANVITWPAATGTAALTSDITTALVPYEKTANKGAASGYAPLDATSKVPAAYLPAYVDDVLEFANLAAFPATGTAGVIYVALDTNLAYRWSGSAYVEISASPGSTDAVPEGATNLYFTNERVDDRVAALVVGGTNITSTYNDVANTLTIAAAAYPTALPPSGTASGDLAGTYPAPTIKASVGLTGTPTAPTAATTTSTTQIATTAYVQANLTAELTVPTSALAYGDASGTVGVTGVLADLGWDATNKRLGIGVGNAPLAALHVKGVDQTVANYDPAGSQAATLYVHGTGTATGTGGAVMFGDGFGPFAAIKGYATSGTGPTGWLSVSTRKLGADTTFTEAARFNADGSLQVTAGVAATTGTFSGALSAPSASITGTLAINYTPPVATPPSTTALWLNRDQTFPGNNHFIATNLYYDGSWRYTVGGIPGGGLYMAPSASSAVSLFYAPTNAGGAGAVATIADALIVNPSVPNITTTLPIIMQSGTAITAGGTLGSGLLFSSTANFGIMYGSGLPNKAAARGSIYIRSDNTSATSIYTNVDGTAGGWQTLSSSGATATVSDTPPGSPTSNQLWWNSATGQMMIWYYDGTSTQWVATSPTAASYATVQSIMLHWSAVSGTVATVATTVFAWDVVTENTTGGTYSAGTFTVPVGMGGIWDVASSMLGSSAATTGNITHALAVNGTVVCTSIAQVNAANGGGTATISGRFRFADSALITLRVYGTASTTIFGTTAGGVRNAWFHMTRVGP